jgi:sarcosine oxidase subunit alpha
MSVMPSVTIVLNGEAIPADPGLTIAAVLLSRGQQVFRRSVAGEARGPLCGMGICFECLVTVDGVAGVRACLEPVRDGMRVDTDA